MSGRRKRQRDTIATVPLPPKVLRTPGSIDAGAAVALEDADGIPKAVRRSNSRPTIHAAVVPPPVPRHVKQRPSAQATQAVPAVPDAFEEEPTSPVDLDEPSSSQQTQAVAVLTDEHSTGKRPRRPGQLTMVNDSAAEHSGRRERRGHTMVADAIDEVAEVDGIDELDELDELEIDLEDSVAGVPQRPFSNTDRFSRPLSLTQSRPQWWMLAAGAVVVAVVLFTALQLAS